MLIEIWQVLLELSPWLLLGTAIAGVLHVALPADFIRRHLSGRGGVFKAVGLGVPLPLCSCGVIPAGIGLKKDGASDGAALGFLISTPQTGVDSILVSASFLGWPFALFKVASAAITGIIGGLLADAGNSEQHLVAPTPAPLKDKASFRELVDHSLEILRSIWRWLVFGIVVSAAITVFVPKSGLSGLAAYGGIVPALLVLVISVPLYVCVIASVPIAAALVAAGLPTGVALVFLMAGPATNVATIGAVYRTFGKRTLTIYLSTIIIGSVALGLLFDMLLGTQTTAVVHGTHSHTAWWMVGSAVILSGLLTVFAVEDLRALFRREPAVGTVKVERPVEGMSCMGCVGKLQRALDANPKVDSAHVELKPGRATISGSLSGTELEAVITATGYTVPIDTLTE